MSLRDNKELRLTGRGGIVHQFWQTQIKEVVEDAGWPASIEFSDEDVYVNMDSAELVIEVAMGDNEREIKHDEKHLEQYDAVWIASRNEDVKTGLIERLEDHGMADAVSLRLFEEFLEQGLDLDPPPQ